MAVEGGRHDRALLVVLGVVVALVVVAVVVVVGRGEPELRDAGTPEGVVQRYAAAVLDGDLLEAEQYLSAQTRADCDSHMPIPAEDTTVMLVSSEERGTEATVRVTVTVSYGDPPFGIDRSSSEGMFLLVEEDDEWRIESVPWQLETCVSRSSP